MRYCYFNAFILNIIFSKVPFEDPPLSQSSQGGAKTQIVLLIN